MNITLYGKRCDEVKDFERRIYSELSGWSLSEVWSSTHPEKVTKEGAEREKATNQEMLTATRSWKMQEMNVPLEPPGMKPCLHLDLDFWLQNHGKAHFSYFKQPSL